MNRMYGNQQQMAYGSRMMRQCHPEEKMMQRENGSSNSCQTAAGYRTEQSSSCTTNPIPTGSKKSLLRYIDEVSFAVYETILYLDTHPNDVNALCFFKTHNELRERALKEYARMYGPLTIANADSASETAWEWMNQPWPWEGGNC